MTLKSIDKKIFAQFQDIFKAMNISERRVQLEMENLNLPPLDFSIMNKLQFDGVEAEENIFKMPPEILNPQIYFKYEERPVIMYLRDQYLTQANYNSGKLRPFHLCFCSALREAEQKNRYESRYVMTYNTSGKFRVNLSIRDRNSEGKVYTLKKEQDIYRPLKVCQHCLREINWKHFRSYCGGGVEWWRGGNALKRHQIVDEFDIEEYFLTTHENKFFNHPVSGTASLAITKEYSLSPEIKAQLKYFADYTCEICRETFSAEELQIHHKNHNEGDNRRANLMVVCPACHALIHDAEGGFTNLRQKSIAKNKISEEKISAAEYAAAQKNLGDMYFNGWGVARDEGKAQIFYKSALESYRELAAKADYDAWYELANCYLFGKGVDTDSYEAARRFTNVFEKYSARANTGDTKAKIRLGLMYAKGLGVAQDLYEAKKIIASIKKDIEVADSELVELCQLTGNIDDAQKFHAKAVQLFEVAANSGDSAAAFELAKLYNNKNFVGEEFEDFTCAGDSDKNFLKAAKDFERKFELKKTAPIIEKANAGDVPAILELKKFAKEGYASAKDALEKLYYDDNKENAKGTVVLREGLTSIAEKVFDYCSSLKETILPESLTSIGNYAFYNCDSLKEIILPENLTSIGNSAFRKCSSLKEVVLPKNLTVINENVFEDCTFLQKIVFPEKITKIYHGAFYNCRSLTKINLPKNLSYIDAYAFYNCISLKEIKFPESLNYIGFRAFSYCNIKTVQYYSRTEEILKNYFGTQWNTLEKILLDD